MVVHDDMSCASFMNCDITTTARQVVSWTDGNHQDPRGRFEWWEVWEVVTGRYRYFESVSVIGIFVGIVKSRYRHRYRYFKYRRYQYRYRYFRSLSYSAFFLTNKRVCHTPWGSLVVPWPKLLYSSMYSLSDKFVIICFINIPSVSKSGIE